MEHIRQLYKKGKYAECVIQLESYKSVTNNNSLIEEVVTKNNLLVAKFQLSYIQEDTSIRSQVSDKFLDLWSNILILPHEKEFNSLALVCACNTIYTFINSRPYKDKDFMIVQKICYNLLDKLACSYQLFSYQENNSEEEKFAVLLIFLLKSKKLSSDEISLVLYNCLLLCFFKYDQKHIQWLKDILNCLELMSIEPQTLFCNHAFLLLPLGASLDGESNHNLIVRELSKILVCINFCIEGSWSDALESIKSQSNSEFLDVWNLIKLYATCHSSEENYVHHFDGVNLLGKTPYLMFASCVIAAAHFALKKKPLLALKCLNCAATGSLTQTKACSIVMFYAATQFKELGNLEFEIQSLRLAKEALLTGASLQLSLHTEMFGFLLSYFKIFQLPEIFDIQYQLAQALFLEQRYKEAVSEYEYVSNLPFRSSEIPFSECFKKVSSSQRTILHEHILVLILAKEWDKVQDVIDSSMEEDYLLFFLRAEMHIQRKNYAKAIQFLSRSIVMLTTTTFSEDEKKKMIMSKFHFKLALLFHENKNNRDAYHQLRLSAKYGYLDSSMIEFCQKFASQLGENFPLTSVNEANNVLEVNELSNDFVIRYALSNESIKLSN